jgi:hypothetical protein
MPIAIGVSSKGTTTGATSVATTGVATQAAGSTIVGAMVFQGTFSNYTDNKTNSPYVQVGSEQVVDTTNAAKLRMYHFPNAVGGAGHTTTAAVTTSQPITNMMAEITGAALSSVVGTSNGATDTTSPYGNLVSITPTPGNYLLLAAFGGNSGSNPATQAETQGFTVLTSAQELNGATLWTGCLAYKLVTADGVTAYTAQFTESGASQGGIILAAFKELASASIGSQRGQGPGLGPKTKRMLARGTRTFASAASGEIAGTDGLAFSQVGALGGLGALAGSTSLTFAQTGALRGSGALSGSAALTFAQSGAVAGVGTLAGSIALTFGHAGALAADGVLAGSATLTFTATATADAPSGAMVGTATLTFGQTGALAGAGALAGTVALQFGQSGAAGGAGALSGVAAFTFAHTADLKGAAALAGTVPLTFGQLGNLTQQDGAIAGTATITFTLSGTVDQPAGTGDGGASIIILRRRRGR